MRAISRMTIVLCMLMGAVSAEEKAPPQIEGDTIAFTLSDFDGKTVSSSDKRFEGKVLLVDLWATWCPPCRLAVPFMTDLDSRYRDKGLEIVGIAFEEGETLEDRGKSAKKFADDKKIRYTLLDGGGSTEDRIHVAVPAITKPEDIPTMVLIGRDGKIKYAHTGFVPADKDAIEGQVKAALAQKAD